MKPIVIIYNPTAGQGRAGERIGEVQALLKEANVDFHLELTEGPAAAAGQARTFAAMKEVTAIVAAGGDGTANEVLNGLMQAKEQNGRIPDFGVLPVGRGNDLGYGMRIPHDLSEAVRVLAQNRTRPVDLGLVTGGDFPEGRYFGNGIGIGFEPISIISPVEATPTEYQVVSINQDKEAIRIAEELRNQGKTTNLVLDKTINKAMEYANSKGIQKVIFVGQKEVESKTFKVKDMTTGKEEKLKI